MADRDLVLTCENCGNRFLYSLEEQRQERDGSSPRPKRCPGCRALDRLTGSQKGMVKWFNPRKGYGFISREGEKDLFVHVSDIAAPTKRLRAGQRVAFRVRESERGPRAVEVEPV